MKKSSKVFLSILLILSIVLTAGCSSKTSAGSASALENIKKAGVLKVGVKSDVPKFSMVDTATNEYSGFEDDLAYEIAAVIFDCTSTEAKEKKMVEFQGVTAKTRGPLLENGEIDLVIATFTITEERKESYNFSTPYFTDAIGLLVKKNNNYTSITDLNGEAIGVAQSSTTKDSIDAYIAENNMEITVTYSEYTSYPEIKAALDSGRVKAFSVDGAILAGYIDDTTQLLPEKFSPQDYGIASNLNNTDLAELVNTSIINLRESGKLNEMLTSWGLESYK